MVQSAVEDAFRTQLSAAGPAVRRGLLLIRKIDLGVISSRRDQSIVNRRLAALLRDAANHAAIDFGEELDQREAVLFPDPIFPLLEIARAMGSGNPVPQSWPYRAVIGERLFGPYKSLLAAILAEQLEAPQGGPGVRAILLALGTGLPDLVVALPIALRIHVLGALTLPELSQTAIAAELDQTDLLDLAQDLARVPDYPAFVTVLEGALAEIESNRVALQILIALMLGEDGRPVPIRRVSLLAVCLSVIASNQHSRGSVLSALHRLSELVSGQAVAFASKPVSQASLRKIPTLDELVPILLGSIQTDSEQQESVGALVSSLADTSEVGEALEAAIAPELHPEPAKTEISGFALTNHAGMAYLIALMNAVYGTWLNRPENIAKATGQRLLSQIIGRFSLHSEDPASCFLRSLGELPEPSEIPWQFSLNPAMLSEVNAAIVTSRVRGHSGWRMATLGRLIIAMWKGRATGDVRALLQHGPALRRTDPREAPESSVLASCEIGLRRYLRAGPKFKMTDLIGRRGELASTATHLDVSFDASLIDLSVRRWALDLSPHWCPWLWRVVTIHYDFGDDLGGPDAA